MMCEQVKQVSLILLSAASFSHLLDLSSWKGVFIALLVALGF
jgi:hypothetical protein